MEFNAKKDLQQNFKFSSNKYKYNFNKKLKEIIVNGVYIIYDQYNFKELTIIDSELQNEPVCTILKILIPLLTKQYSQKLWNEDEEIFKVFYGFINKIKREETLYETIVKTVLTYGHGLSNLNPEIFPLFTKKIITYQELYQNANLNNQIFFKLKFSNNFLKELLNSPIYTIDDILDNINLFEIDYASSLLKLKNINLYMNSIIWTPEKIYRQQLSFTDIMNNIEYFSYKCIEEWSYINCTSEERDTLLMIKEII